jgi:DtxR family Mn-dependent transcriptional regulator
VEPVVLPLSELPSGQDARVLYISSRHHDRLDRLSSMGVLPGAELRVHQRLPSYVVQLGEMTLALDQAIAEDIYVRRKDNNGQK